MEWPAHLPLVGGGDVSMVAKRISQDDFSENGVGRRSNRSFRMRTMTVWGSSLTHSPRRVVPYFTDIR